MHHLYHLVEVRVFTPLHLLLTDDCNNVITCERTITLSDSRPPVLTIMAIDTIVECGLNNSIQLTAWLNNHAGATATDGCSALGQLVWVDTRIDTNHRWLWQYCGLSIQI